MKDVHRSILVTPPVLPIRLVDSNDLWDHKAPLLSVVIPCRNYGNYIHETISSLQSQTFTDFEIIIVDDGSDDRSTLQVLHELQRNGIKVLRQKKLNAATALNRGIRTARSRYVCCLGADDLLEPTYFEKCLCLLESNPGVAIAYSLVRTFGGESQIWFTQPFDLRLLLEYNYICAAAVFHKVVWEQVGGFDEVMDGYEDWDFWLKAGEAGFRGRLIPQLLFNYRRHGITLNIRSDRVYQKLVKYIRSKHSSLYIHSERAATIAANYSDLQVPEPVVNLSAKRQYGNLVRKSGSGKATFRAGLRFRSNSRALNSNARRMVVLTHAATEALPVDPVARAFNMNPILVITGQITCSKKGIHRTDLSNAYALSLFLDPYCWLDFILNLIETRSASMVLISGSKLAYEWVPKIKASVSVPVVDILSTQTSGISRLSARYDGLIDLHVVMSREIAKYLSGAFELSAKKICLFSVSDTNASLADKLAS